MRGKIFATVPPEKTHIHIFVEESAVRALTTTNPTAFEALMWGNRIMGVRVDLRHADLDVICDLLLDAWRRVAPKGLATQYEERVHGADGTQ